MEQKGGQLLDWLVQKHKYSVCKLVSVPVLIGVMVMGSWGHGVMGSAPSFHPFVASGDSTPVARPVQRARLLVELS